MTLSKYIFCALFINGQKSQTENEIDFIHLGFYTPLHNHNPANFSLREIITLMKIKYNLKFTFIFIYLKQVRINLKWLGKQEEKNFSKKSPSVCVEMDLIWQSSYPAFLPLSPLPLISSISVSHIKPKSNLLLSNNLNLWMFGRGSRLAAINISDVQ